MRMHPDDERDRGLPHGFHERALPPTWARDIVLPPIHHGEKRRLRRRLGEAGDIVRDQARAAAAAIIEVGQRRQPERTEIGDGALLQHRDPRIREDLRHRIERRPSEIHGVIVGETDRGHIERAQPVQCERRRHCQGHLVETDRQFGDHNAGEIDDEPAAVQHVLKLLPHAFGRRGIDQEAQDTSAEERIAGEAIDFRSRRIRANLRRRLWLVELDHIARRARPLAGRVGVRVGIEHDRRSRVEDLLLEAQLQILRAARIRVLGLPQPHDRVRPTGGQHVERLLIALRRFRRRQIVGEIGRLNHQGGRTEHGLEALGKPVPVLAARASHSEGHDAGGRHTVLDERQDLSLIHI